MRALITFLIEDCCDGHPEVCNLAGLLREANCCSPPPKRNQGNKQRRT
jgi:ArsR family transcriptional regulator, arsenate/arsenite/antimonite-responsive transcriptional repressor